MKRFLVRLGATFLFTGYAPVAPATAGSAAALFLWWWIGSIPPGIYLAILAGLALVGTWLAHQAEEMFGHDGKPIVIDEVLGAWITVAFVPGDPLRIALIGFLLFRVLDVVKPPPAYQFQSLRGGYGVMADDVMAAIYGNLILQVAARLWPSLLGA
jgi:phosphatidylglycerophosphatase A